MRGQVINRIIAARRRFVTRGACESSDGFAVVEAVIVFPVMLMVFLGLIMLSIYLPQRAMLQRATQMAATAIATEMGDPWIYYDQDKLSYERYTRTKDLPNVYDSLFRPNTSAFANRAVGLAQRMDEVENIPLISSGELTVSCSVVNYLVYREVAVTSTRSIKVPVDFSVVKFPKTVELTVTAKATVKDGDDFVRNVDLGLTFVAWLKSHSGGMDTITSAFDNQKLGSLLGF